MTGYLPFSELFWANSRAIERIDNYTDHRLQGWREAGHITTEFRLDAASDNWQPMQKLLAYPDPQREAIKAFIDATPWSTRTRQLSRLEAWEQGQREMTRLPLHCVPEILGPDLANKKPDGSDYAVADDLTFTFSKAGEDDLVYRAIAQRPDGQKLHLTPGVAYRTWINPYDTSILFVSHAAGGFIGICELRARVERGDDDAFKRAASEAARVHADVLEPYYRRALRKNRAVRRQRETNVALVDRQEPADTTIEDYETPNYGSMKGK